MTADLSVIVAVYNEDPRNLVALLDRLQKAIAPLDMSHEVIFVNDGSGPETSQALRGIVARYTHTKLLNLSRNFGQQAAISAGLAESEGRAVVNIDSDLQDPPELIGDMVRLWRQGYEVVYAQRSTRRDRVGKRLSAFLFYRILGALSSVDIPWDTGDFRLMDRKVVDTLVAMPEKTRFLRGLIPWLGFKQVGVAIDRDAREFGESTYTIGKLLKLAMDGLLSFSMTPLFLIASVGLFLLAIGLFGLAGTACAYASHLGDATGLFIVLSLVAVSGLQIACTGLVAIYLSKVLDEVRARPTFVVSERLGQAYGNVPLLHNAVNSSLQDAGRNVR